MSTGWSIWYDGPATFIIAGREYEAEATVLVSDLIDEYEQPLPKWEVRRVLYSGESWTARVRLPAAPAPTPRPHGNSATTSASTRTGS